MDNSETLEKPKGQSRMDNPETLEKPKGQSRMDNQEKLATLGTQETRLRQTKQNKNIIWAELL